MCTIEQLLTPRVHMIVMAERHMLKEFIAVNRDEIIRRCRAKVARRSMPPVTPAEIDHGVPLFLDQLVDVLRTHGSSTATIRTTSVLHGHDLQLQGLTVGQVVHDYGDVCQSITELAMETDAPISADDFRNLNRCLDDAIASAVTEFGRERGQSHEERETANLERLGFFTHELRNLTHTAMVALDVLQVGNVGVNGSTGAVLRRSLVGLTTLIDKSLAEVRLTRGVQNRESFSVSAFIEEIAAAAELDARNHALTLTVTAAEDVWIEADRRSLAAVMQNLLQNAIKFTKPHSTVMLRVRSTPDRVLIDVEDECGGLPVRDATELFEAFEQRSADRSGLGLGLAFCRWAVQANHGVISARTVPGKGCVFTVDLPRCAVPAVA
jgi:signal transduction histidine kinase